MRLSAPWTILFCFASISLLWAEPGPFSPSGEGGAGAWVAPFRDDWGGLVNVKFSLSCSPGENRCVHFPSLILDTSLRIVFDGDPLTHSIPFFELQLIPTSIQLRPWLLLNAGRIRLQSSPRVLDEEIGVTAELGQVQVNLHRQNQYAQGGCSVGIGLLGGRYLHFWKNAQPFSGLHLLSLNPECSIEGRRGRFLGQGGIGLMAELAVGQSGDGTPDQPGSFGQAILDAWFRAWVRFGITLAKMPKSQTIFVQLDVRYQALIDQGNRIFTTGLFIGIYTGISF